MNNYDNQVLGVGNSMHPANQPEIEAGLIAAATIATPVTQSYVQRVRN
jgi:hypothetical protein